METLHEFYLWSENKMEKHIDTIISSLRRYRWEEGLASNGNILELEHFRLTLGACSVSTERSNIGIQ